MQTAKRMLLIGVFLVLPLTQVPADSKTDVAALIGRLGSDQFSEREEAAKALEALGAPALESLRKATQSADLEVRRRAEMLVRKIEQRVDAVRLLTPRKVHWMFQDTPVAEAVKQIAAKTGFTINLEGSAGLAERKLTLDTGEVGFWEAWDRFCAAAGLMETTPAADKKKVQPAQGAGINNIQMVNGRVWVNGIQVNGPQGPRDLLQAGQNLPRKLTLKDGKSESRPTHYAGSIRVRGLPAGKAASGPTFQLEIAAEPSIAIREVAGVRIEHALDDQGRKVAQLEQPEAPANQAAGFVGNGFGGNGVIIINGQVINGANPGEAGQDPKHVPVHLKLSEKPGKLLKEVKGSAHVLVQGRPEPLVRIDNILKGGEQTVAGLGGSSIKVSKVERAENGEVTVTMLVTPPPSQQRANGQMGAAGAAGQMIVLQQAVAGARLKRVRNGNNVATGADLPQASASFALQDAQGKAYQIVKALDTGKGTGTAIEVELHCKPKDGVGEAARLIYTGVRSCMIEVPFSLKNVPLP